MVDDTRDRVIRVEAEIDSVKEDITDIKVKVDVMYEVLMQAKGAQWLLLGTAAFLGFLASMIPKLYTYWSK